jgi:serine/threonine-protein kinase RsbW
MTEEATKQRIELKSQVESIAQIESLIDELCERFSICEDDYGNILIALTEAINNAITHGNRLDPEKIVSLDVDSSSKELEFTVEDQGNGFDLNEVPDPTLPENIEKLRGRGIYLMKNLADNITFENNGSKIKLIFSISAN